MRTTVVAVALWALAVGPLASCSNSTAPPDTTTKTKITTTALPTTPPGTPSAVPRTKADLDALLLTLADLPPGFKPDTKAGPDYTVMSGCTEEAIALEGYRQDALTTTGTAFTTTTGRLVIQSLTLLPGAESNTLGTLKKAVARCTTWSAEARTYTMSKADHGSYGEESLSYRVKTDSDLPFVMDVVFLRKANLLVAIMVAGVGSSTPKDAQYIFDTAAGKIHER